MCVFAVARLAKSMNMTVWGLVRVLPIAEQRSEHVDEYRFVMICG